MQNTRFPKAVEFLRNAMLGKEGYDMTLAQELTKLVNELGKAEGSNAKLQAEIELLDNALGLAREVITSLKEAEEEDSYPQYPDNFYVHGADAMSYHPSDEDIQAIIDDLHEVELEDGQFVEQAIGATTVIKLRSNGANQLIVAEEYASFIYDDVTGLSGDEGTENVCDFPNCDCDTPTPSGQGGFGF